MITEAELEMRCKVAEAKLAVIEDLRWLVAPLAGATAHLLWHTGLLSSFVGLVTFFALPYSFSKEYDRAWDEFGKVHWDRKVLAS